MKWCSTSRSANCLRKSSSGTEAFVSAPPSASHTHTHTHTKTAEEMCHKSKGFLLQARLSGPLQIKGREAVAGSFPRGHMVQPQFSLLFHYTVDSTGKKKKKKSFVSGAFHHGCGPAPTSKLGCFPAVSVKTGRVQPNRAFSWTTCTSALNIKHCTFTVLHILL